MSFPRSGLFFRQSSIPHTIAVFRKPLKHQLYVSGNHRLYPNGLCSIRGDQTSLLLHQERRGASPEHRLALSQVQE